VRWTTCSFLSFCCLPILPQNAILFLADCLKHFMTPSPSGAFCRTQFTRQLTSVLFNVPKKAQYHARNLLQKSNPAGCLRGTWYEVLLARRIWHAGCQPSFLLGNLSGAAQNIYTYRNELVRHYVTFNKQRSAHQTVQSGDVLFNDSENLHPPLLIRQPLATKASQANKVHKTRSFKLAPI